MVAQIVGLARSRAGERPAAAVLGMGVAAPGPLDPGAGIVLAPPTLARLAATCRSRRCWRSGWACRCGSRTTPTPPRSANGGSAPGGARATWSFVTVSTGIGGGVIADGRLLHGRRGLAAEIGHMTRDPGPGPLRLRRRRLLGGAGLRHRARAGRAAVRAVGRTRDPRRPARAGDEAARALLDDEARWLGVGIANLLHLYSPERVVLGGGVMRLLRPAARPAAATVAARAMPAYRDVPILPAALGANAGLVGAASLVLA